MEKYKYLGIILSNNGNFKHVVDHPYQKSLKAIFALKSNILDYDLINNSLKLKLFDTLVRPILSYGAEIWIGDYTTKLNSLDNLPFEKIHNRFCKYLLGVHKKASNFASRLEFGREPIFNFICSQSFKYYSHLSQLPDVRLLKEAFELDKTLFQDGYKSWYSRVHNFMQKFSITEAEVKANNILDILLARYSFDMNNELSRLRAQPHANKLHTFSNVYSDFSLQKYLSFGLPKDKTKGLLKLRISAHDLLVERGRYFRPQIPRDQRVCATCNKLEDEEHFILYYTKYCTAREILFNKTQIVYPDLKSDTEKSVQIFTCLMNPVTEEETKRICNFITASISS